MKFLLLLASFQTLIISSPRDKSATVVCSSIIYENNTPFNNNQTNNLGCSVPQILFKIPLVWEKPTDERYAYKINKRLAFRKKHLNRQIKRFEAKAKKKLANKNKRKAAIFREKAKEARLGYAEMEQAQKELKQLGLSREKFTFIKNPDDISYTYMNSDGTIVIEFNSYVNAVHELTHAFQHLSGQIEYVIGTGGAIYVDIVDELKAYKRQYFFAPYSFNKLKSKSYIKIKVSANIRSFWVSSIYFMKEGKRSYPYENLKMTPSNKPKE